MRNHGCIVGVLLSLALCASGQESGRDDGVWWNFGYDPVAWWSFDDDATGETEDVVEGKVAYGSGVKGNALLLDGLTTCIIRKREQAPKLGDYFTIEAWIALGAYPWNFCPIVTQSKEGQAGYCFGIGPRGQVTLELAVGGKWHKCSSDDFAVPLGRWMHVVGTYSCQSGAAVYVNGRPTGQLDVKGKPQYAENVEFRIGANHEKKKPSNIHREQGTLPGWFSLDGKLDEVKLYDRQLSAEEIWKPWSSGRAIPNADLPARVMPSGPKGPGRFGAYYAKLDYYPQWDDLWAVGPDPDVLVRFDESAARVVFWRGSRYSPAWVSGNGPGGTGFMA